MQIGPKWISGDDYKACIALVPITTVDVVLFNESLEQVLLFKRTNEPLKGEYYTPGGRLFKGEALQECAIRQAKKELGLAIKPEELVEGGVTSDFHPHSAFEESDYHCINVYWGYILREEGAIQLDEQHSASKWFSVTDNSLHPYIKERIRTTLPQLKKSLHDES